MSSREEDYDYQIVEFVRRGPKTDKKCVDCVPTHWISFNKNKGRVECQYMAPPYNTEDYLLLNNLIRSRACAPEDWPSHTVNIKGGARTYANGLARVKLLEKEEYAFSNDSAVTPQQKAAELLRQHKQKQLKLRKEAQDALLVSELQSCSDEEEIGQKHQRSGKTKLQKNAVSRCSDKSSLKFGGLATAKIPLPSTSKNVEFEVLSSKKNLRNRGNEPRKMKLSVNEVYSDSDENSSIKDSYQPTREPSNSEIDSDGKTSRGRNARDLNNVELHPQKANTERHYTSHSSGGQNSRDDRENPKSNKPEKNKVKQNHSGPSVTAAEPVSLRTVGKIFSDLQLIKADLQKIQVDITEIKSNQGKILETHRGSEIEQIIRADFFATNHLELPFNDKASFDEFDAKLKTDENFRKDFMKSLSRFFDRENVTTKTLTNILKKYLSADFAIKFTAMKKMPDKYLLCDTTFYNYLLDVIRETHRDPLTGKFITEKLFLSALGTVLGNAKDWKSSRKRRAKTIDRMQSVNQTRDGAQRSGSESLDSDN